MRAKEILLIPLYDITGNKNDIWQFKDSKYINITYEDNVEKSVNGKILIFNRYVWEPIVYYPNTKITSDLGVESIMDDFYNSDVHIKALEKVFKKICLDNNIVKFEDKEPILRKIYEVVNMILNHIVMNTSEYVFTLDSKDFIDVIKDEEIRKIHSNLKPDPDSIEQAYKLIKNRLNNMSISNRFVRSYRSKAMNENQANQCIGPRGFVTDINRTVFKEPIYTGFIYGLHRLFDVIAESRTAAKALNASDISIKDSEYTSRRLQLLSMVVENVEHVDCRMYGEPEYMDFLVNANNIVNLKGKYYLDEDNVEKCITGNEKHLYDKVIKLRTILGCKLPNIHNVCYKCIGEIANNFPSNSNLGYMMTSFLMEKCTQSILSTKHLTNSVKKSHFRITGNSSKFFNIDQNESLFYIKNVIHEYKNLKIIIPSSKVNKILNYINVGLHNDIEISNIGEIEQVFMKYELYGKEKVDVCNLVDNDRSCIFTIYFLEYIKNNQHLITTDSKGNLVVDLSKYNLSEPIFYSPIRENNMLTFVNIIARIVETKDFKYMNNKDKDLVNPYSKLIALFTHVTSQFNINISILEPIIYATTVFSYDDVDYRLGRFSRKSTSRQKSEIFRNRSLSQLLVFEDQINNILNYPTSLFYNIRRMKHPLDVLFTPNKIVKK